MQTLVALLILVVVLALLSWLFDQLPIEPPWKNMIRVVLVLIAILYLLAYLVGAPLPRLR